MSKAEVDRNAAPFFFSEAIGIRSSESFDERRFPVIYVTGGSDDDVAHGSSFIVAFPIAHISAAMEAARPAPNPKITTLFQMME